MSTDGDVLHPVSAHSRSTRSHSLKQQSQPMVLFKQRSKRTMSLPSKPVLLPLINVQRCHNNWDDKSDEGENEDENEEEMGTTKRMILSYVLYVILAAVLKRTRERLDEFDTVIRRTLERSQGFA